MHFKQQHKSLFCTLSLRIPERCFQLLNAEENMKERHEPRLLRGNGKSWGNARLFHHLNLLSFKTKVGRCLQCLLHDPRKTDKMACVNIWSDSLGGLREKHSGLGQIPCRHVQKRI